MNMKLKLKLLIFLLFSIFAYSEQYTLNKILDDNSGLPTKYVYCIFQDSKGIVWFGTQRGLVRYNGIECSVFNDKNTNLVKDDIKLIFERNDELIVLCDSYYCFKNNDFVEIQLEEPYTRDKHTVLPEGIDPGDKIHVNDSLFDKEGNYWIASNIGVLLYSQTTFIAEAKLDVNINICLIDNGKIYIGTENGLFLSGKEIWPGYISMIKKAEKGIYFASDEGLFLLDDGSIQRVIKYNSDNYYDRIYSIYFSQDIIYLGVRSGLLVYNGLVTENCFNDIDNFKIRDIIELDGVYYLATPEGVYTFDRHSFSTSCVFDIDCLVYCFYQDGNILWVATELGIYKVDLIKNLIIHHTLKTGLPANEIYSFLDDGNGSLWCSCEEGVFKFNKVMFDNNQLTTQKFSSKDGLRNAFMVGGLKSVAQSFEGKFYFCSKDIVYSVDPSMIVKNTVPPDIVLERILVNGVVNNNLVMSPGKNKIEFLYSGISYKYPEGVSYKYRLGGYENIWNYTYDRKVSYNNLSPGNYIFEVMAANADEVWSTVPTEVSFTVLRPFYMTWWFYILAVIVISFLMNLFYKGLSYLFHSVTFLRRSTFIGPHKVLAMVGSGGMGTVYKAKNIETSDIVAIKVLHENVTDERTKMRFLQEGIICEQVQHPNVIRMFDRGEDRGRLYYAMEFVNGVTLRRLINEKKLCMNCALAVVSLLSEIIHSIHSYGIVHRDIKPDNLMIGEGMDTVRHLTVEDIILKLRGKLTLLDFGLAKMIGNTALTQTGLLAGTVYYLPPEAMEEKKEWYPEIDYYSMGIMLYEMLTYTNPFEGNDMLAVVYKVMNKVPLTPSAVNSKIPKTISDFTMRLIEKDPDRRLKNYHEIKKALDTLLTK